MFHSPKRTVKDSEPQASEMQRLSPTLGSTRVENKYEISMMRRWKSEANQTETGEARRPAGMETRRQ
jgi:hypothetical protein